MIHVVHVFGAWQDLSVDGAKEFNSADTEDWAERHNIHVPRPLPRNPTGNLAVERFRIHCNARVAASDVKPWWPTAGQPRSFRVELQTRHLGFSSFEVMFGTPAVTQAINYARGVRDPMPVNLLRRSELN